jgi:cytoskeleton protein RodZ
MALGLTVEDMSESLRIRRVYLAALEDGRVKDLPAPAYAVGFVRTYARALGLDDDEVVRRFREASGVVVQRKLDLVFPEPVPDRGVPAGALVLVGAILAIGAYVGWYQWSGTGTRTVDAVPVPPPAIEQAIREPTPPEVPPVVGAPPTGASASAAPALGAVNPRPPAVAPVPPATVASVPPAAEEGRIVLRATADAWLMVRNGKGGPALINKVLRAGESFTVPPEPGLVLATGNIRNLEILVDGAASAGFVPGSPARRGILLDPDKLKAEKIGATAAAPPPPKPKPVAKPRGGGQPSGADAAYVPPG